MWFGRYFYRFFGSFYRCGGAAISEFRGGLSSPPAAAKTVRTISRIDHILEKRKELGAASLRSAAKLNGELKEKINFCFVSLPRSETKFLLLG